VNRWYGWVHRLSNWQFVAYAAGVTILVLVVMDCVLALLTRQADLASSAVFGVVFTVGFTAFQAWKRWK
jgi:hypothetical protein